MGFWRTSGSLALHAGATARAHGGKRQVGGDGHQAVPFVVERSEAWRSVRRAHAKHLPEGVGITAIRRLVSVLIAAAR